MKTVINDIATNSPKEKPIFVPNELCRKAYEIRDELCSHLTWKARSVIEAITISFSIHKQEITDSSSVTNFDVHFLTVVNPLNHEDKKRIDATWKIKDAAFIIDGRDVAPHHVPSKGALYLTLYESPKFFVRSLIIAIYWKIDKFRPHIEADSNSIKTTLTDYYMAIDKFK